MREAIQQAGTQQQEYPENHLPLQRTTALNTQRAEYWTRFERALCNSFNNVFKHHLLLNEHGADGQRIISDLDKTHIGVLAPTDSFFVLSFFEGFAIDKSF